MGARQQKGKMWHGLQLLTSFPQTLTSTHPPLQTISHDELVKAQREDQAINMIMELKETNTKLTDEARKTVSGATRKLLHEWSRLYIVNDLL